MVKNWRDISQEGREWYRTFKQNSFKGPFLLIGLGISCIGQDNYFLMVLVEFVLKSFFNYSLPADQNEFINLILRNTLGFSLVIYGCHLFWRRIYPSKIKEKATLIIHEIISSFDVNELKNVLVNYKVKAYKINFTKYLKGGQLTDLDIVLKKHLEMIRKIPKGPCLYFGHAHIPFIMLTAYLLKDRSLKPFERDHKTGCYHFSWDENKNKLDDIHMIIPTGELENLEEIAIKVSFSVEVKDEHIHDKLGANIKIGSLALENVTLRSIKNKEDIDNFIDKYRILIEKIKSECPRLKVLHLFIAAPPSIPLRIGAMLSQTHDPELRVYNWTNSTGYSWGLSIQKGTLIYL